MFDETDVVPVSESELPVAGDSTDFDGDVAGADDEQVPEEWRAYAQKHVSRLQSKKDRELAAVSKELATYRQQAEEAKVALEKETRKQTLIVKWTQQYIEQGHSPQDALHYATTNAADRVEQEFQARAKESKLERYERQEQEQQQRQSLTAFRDELIEKTGLSEAQLRQAMVGLHADAQDFKHQAWTRALAMARTVAQTGQAQDNRTLRNQVPFIASGARAGKVEYSSLPQNVQLGTATGDAFIEEQRRLRRSRNR